MRLVGIEKPHVTHIHPIVDVSDWGRADQEELGTKTKQWLVDEHGRRWLFKEPRPRTGDDWAERVAADLAEILGLPHCTVELAASKGVCGTISLDFTQEGSIHKWSLTLANRLLWERDPGYPKTQFRGVRSYTVDRVLDLFMEYGAGQSIMPDKELLSAPEAFTGYLLFDAWIGNQDRHHENFGILFPVNAAVSLAPELAPSFDHAAALGQTILDSERETRLSTKDKNQALPAWLLRARGALYGQETDKKPLSTFDAFARAAIRYPRGARYWLDKLARIEPRACVDALSKLPPDRSTEISRRFAARMLELNRDHLLQSHER